MKRNGSIKDKKKIFLIILLALLILGRNRVSVSVKQKNIIFENIEHESSFSREKINIEKNYIFKTVVFGDFFDIINIIKENETNRINMTRHKFLSNTLIIREGDNSIFLSSKYIEDIFSLNIIEYDYPYAIYDSDVSGFSSFKTYKSFIKNNEVIESLKTKEYISIPFKSSTELYPFGTLFNELKAYENAECRFVDYSPLFNDNECSKFKIKLNGTTKPIGIDSINIYENYNEIIFRELENVQDSEGINYALKSYYINVYFESKYFNKNKTIITILK